jgi:signal transduction histidine kinase
MQSYKVGRAPLSLFEDGSMGFGGNIEEGSEVQFGVGNLNQILQSSKKTFDYMAQESIESIFIYSCTARKTFMGQFIDKELAPLQELAPTTGFFTYGEFFTHNKAKTCSLLNETMTTLALSENKQSSPHKDFALKFFENDSYENITSRALLHFVNKTSSELQELNTMLEKRVQDEVLLNHEKEKLILAQSRRATMGEMTRMIAHQWRQPLSSIGLAIDNLMLDVMLNDVNPQNIEETSKIVKNQVHYLSKTINDFSNYFEPENIVESFNAKELFSELMNMIGHDLHQHNIEVFTNFLNLEEIHSYKRELFQICLNLFNNAKDVLLQKNVKHKYIKLTYRFIDGHHEIHISDNAGGVSDEIKEKIFEPYFSTKVQKNGTGLGLYMSKTIAQSYLEGDLSCSNDKQGAIFLLQFKNKSQEGEKK